MMRVAGKWVAVEIFDKLSQAFKLPPEVGS